MLTVFAPLLLSAALGARAEDGTSVPLPPPPLPTLAPPVLPDLEPPPGLVAHPSGFSERVPVIPPRRNRPASLIGPDRDAAGRELQELLEDFGFFNDFAIANMSVKPSAVCSVPEEFWLAFRGHYQDMLALEERLKARFPSGWGALAAEPKRYEYELERIEALESQAGVQAPRFIDARAQCRYVADGLAGTPQGRAAVGRAGSPFAGKTGPSGAQLDGAFDGSEPRAGAVPGMDEGVPGQPSGTGVPPAAGLKTSAVPLESFESLTQGIVFSGPDQVPGFLGVMKDNPAKEAFNEALRHLYSIPAGKEVLRDVQAMLARTEAQRAENLPKLKAEMAKQAAELERLKADPAADAERVKELEESLEMGEKYLLPALENGPKPRVAVMFIETPHRTGGTAAANMQFWKFDDEPTASQVLPVRLHPRILNDGNPGRAVDKLLSHELRHAADCGQLDHDHSRRTEWLLIEDRAFLQEARATLEQREAMRKEPGSSFVQGMYEGDTVPMVRDPISARNNLLKRPNYVWHVTPADFTDPESALRARLSTVYGILTTAPKSELEAEVKTLERPGSGLGEAFRQARAAARKNGNFYGEEAHFVRLAAESEAAKAWLKDVAAMAAGFNADSPEGRKRREAYRRMESEYFSGLGTLAAGGDGAR